jgi:PKD repeat protein
VAGEGFRAEIIANATQAYTGATIKFDASIRGGTPPYSYSWSSDLGLIIDQDRSITLNFFEPGTFTYILTATDSNGQTASDTVQITVEERPAGGVLPPPETGQEGQLPGGGGLLPGIAPGEEEGELPGELPPPSPDDTGGEEGASPPSTTEEEQPSPPGGDTGEEEGAAGEAGGEGTEEGG